MLPVSLVPRLGLFEVVPTLPCGAGDGKAMLPVSFAPRAGPVLLVPRLPCGAGAGKAMLPVSDGLVACAIAVPVSARPRIAAHAKADIFIEISF